ncbi:MAG: hypothetical protein PHI98_16340 [Eubacteriales bacterium]|nr:hypothetical protein [Eubacteriales bacterium]
MLAYLRLQLLNKLRGYVPGTYRRENQKKSRAVMSYIGFTILALYLCGMLVWLEMLMFDQFAAIGQERAVLAVALLAGTFVTLLYGFFGLISQLFFGRDTSFLAALPISSRAVLAVKTAMVVLGEAGVTLVVSAPMFIRLGLYTAAGVDFYLKAFLTCLFVPLVPLSVAMAVGFLLIRLSGLWKRREGVTTIVSFAFMIGIMMLSMYSQKLSGQQLQDLLMTLVLGKGSITSVILAHYPPLQWANNAMSGQDLASWGWLALFMIVSLAVIGLFIWVLGKNYLGLAIRQNESLRKVNEGHRKVKGIARTHTPFAALLRQELREVLTVPTYATNCLTGVVMFPMMLIIMYVGMVNNGGIVNFALEMGKLIPRDYFMAGALGLMCVVNGMGMAVSTAVSREGKRHEMRKTYPISGATHLLAKVVMGMILNLITAITTSIVLWILLPSFWLETLAALLLGQIFNFLWCSCALMIDVRRPNLQWKTEMEAVKQNMNGFLSMLMSLGLAGLLGGVVYLAVTLGASLLVGLGASVAVMIVGAAVAYRLLVTKMARVYYLQ